MKLLLPLIICSALAFAIAQSPASATNPKSDTTEINSLNTAISDYYTEYPDSAIEAAQLNFQRASEIDFTRGMAISQVNIGRSYVQKEDFYKALDFLLNSLTYTGYYDDFKIAAVVYLELGKIYTELYDLLLSEEMTRKGLSYNRKAIEVLQNRKLNFDEDIPLILAMANLATGRAYMRLYQVDPIYIDSAMFYLKVSKETFEASGVTYMSASIYQDFSLLNPYQDRFDMALVNARQYLIEIERALPEALPNAEILVARMLGKLKRYDSAYWYAHKALKAQLESGNQVYLNSTYEVLGEIALQEKRYPQAIQFYTKVLELGKKNRDMLAQQVAYNNLVTCYEKLGDFKSAFSHLTSVNNLRDSLFQHQNAARMEGVQRLFDNAQHLKQIQELNAKAEIDGLLVKRNRLISWVVGVSLVIAIVFFVIVLRQYRLLRKAKQSQARLFAETDQMKSRFFANISHEFRTPLTLMLTPLEKHIDQAQTPQLKDELLVMKRNGHCLLSLVNQLLDLSKIEFGSMVLQMKRVNLSNWLKPLIGQFLSIAEARNISIKASLQPDVVWPVDVDKMEQVILNLLSNAVKFTPDGGLISISLNKVGNEVQIEFTDTGIGIPQEQLARIFDRFYQVDNSNRREYEGTGIGLALARELVELHKGRITVSSSTGKGSSFKVLLPDAPEVKIVSDQEIFSNAIVFDSSQDQSIDITEVDAESKPSVLIVEDNADLRKYIATELSKHYRILTAIDGQEGFELAQQIPDLIISDLMMPKVSGLELCKQVKSGERTSHIPVILLTARADQQDRTEGLQTGADDYIPKPFQLNELMVRIQNLIESRKRLRKLFSVQISLRPSDIQGQSLDDRFMKKVLEAVEADLSNQLFGVEPLADAVAMSSVQLYRKLKAITGKTPNEVIREIRLERAASMLQKQMGSVAEIAYQVGFNNLSYFSKCFRERFGNTPSDYGKLNRG